MELVRNTDTFCSLFLAKSACGVNDFNGTLLRPLASGGMATGVPVKVVRLSTMAQGAPDMCCVVLLIARAIFNVQSVNVWLRFVMRFVSGRQ